MKVLFEGIPSFALALVLMGTGVGCGVADTQQSDELSSTEVSSAPSTETAADSNAVRASAYAWVETRLDRCGKNSNCGGPDYNEGFYSTRECTCHNVTCGSWSCGPWKQSHASCGC